MNVKLQVLSIGVLFFAGHSLMAQKAKSDTAIKTKNIDEVVLVGYGRKETTAEKVGNYAVVGKENLENTHFTTVDNALTGSVAGVATNMTSGQPGANVNILIRGIGSLTQDTTPLIIIDGIPQYTGDVSAIVATTNALASINSNDIEELVVLKDASATSIYGSRGANGVILIKTKSGKKGKAKFNFNSTVGFNNEAFNKLKLLNAQEQINLYALGQMNAGTVTTMAQGIANAKSYFKWNGVTDTNWKDAVTRKTPYLNTYNFQASGGNDLATIFASLSYDDYQGIARDAVMQRLTATVNSTFKMSDKIDLRAGFTGGRVNTEGPIDNNFTANPIKGAYQISPTQSIWNIAEDPSSGYNDHLLYYTANSTFNSVAIQQLNKNQNIQGRITGYLEGTYNITPEIYFTSKISGYLLKSTDFGFRNPHYGDGASDVSIPTGDGNNPIASLHGQAYAIDATYTTWAFTNFAGYAKTFADRHSVKFDIGMEVNKYDDSYVAAYGYGYDLFYSGLGYTTVNNSQSSQLYGVIRGGQNKSAASLVGYISSLNYSFDKKYTINGTFRRDGSSRFGPEKTWGNFWSVGASWNIDKENFINTDIFNELKLRGSYGTQGRQPDGYYSWFSSAAFTGYSGQGAFAPTFVDKDLHWESQKQLNLGLDFGLFNSKVSGSLDYFEKKGTEQIIGAFLEKTVKLTT